MRACIVDDSPLSRVFSELLGLPVLERARPGRVPPFAIGLSDHVALAVESYGGAVAELASRARAVYTRVPFYLEDTGIAVLDAALYVLPVSGMDADYTTTRGPCDLEVEVSGWPLSVFGGEGRVASLFLLEGVGHESGIVFDRDRYGGHPVLAVHGKGYSAPLDPEQASKRYRVMKVSYRKLFEAYVVSSRKTSIYKYYKSESRLPAGYRLWLYDPLFPVNDLSFLLASLGALEKALPMGRPKHVLKAFITIMSGFIDMLTDRERAAVMLHRLSHDAYIHTVTKTVSQYVMLSNISDTVGLWPPVALAPILLTNIYSYVAEHPRLVDSLPTVVR